MSNEPISMKDNGKKLFLLSFPKQKQLYLQFYKLEGALATAWVSLVGGYQCM